MFLLFGFPHVASAGTSTVTVFWNGAFPGTLCSLCSGDFACSIGGVGNWNNGMKTFSDPVPPGAVINQVSAVVYGAAGCVGGATEIDLQLQGTTIEHRTLSGQCVCMVPCETHTFVSPTVASWPGYDYGGTQTVSVDVASGMACVHKIELTLTWLESCGDGIIDPDEGCDDGNVIAADGCSPACQLEPCRGCSGAPSVCSPLPDGAACEDGVFCNGSDTCMAGVCGHAGDPCVGNADCNDVCNEAQDTCAEPFQTPCTSDGNPCTADVCDSGATCTHHAHGSFCDDGIFCNGVDICSGTECAIHIGDPCAFNDCRSVCDEISTSCIATTAGTPCVEDNNLCTHDRCDGAGFCEHSPKPAGTSCTDDGEVCTLDRCNAFGSCVHPPAQNGIACSDDNACTQTDSCQAGSCAGSNPVVCPAPPPCRITATCDPDTGTCGAASEAAIRDGCRDAAKSTFKYQNGATDEDDKLNWKWTKGTATDQDDVADPTDSATYELCIFAENQTSDPAVFLSADVPPSTTLWKESKSGYRYKESTGVQEGITRLVAKGGAEGKAKMLVKGRGASLSDPTLPLTPDTTGLRVQLNNSSSGVCWESAFPISTVTVTDDGIRAKVQ